MTDFTTDSCPAAGATAIGLDTRADDGQYVLHAMPGILLHLHGEHWAPVYLPALRPYLVHDLEPRVGRHGYREGCVVRLPEGPRGRLAKLENRVDCAVSPRAPAPCEGHELGRDLRHDERVDDNGHVWQPGIYHRYCARCYASGAVRPLVSELAPVLASSDSTGAVTCFAGDDATRAKLRAATMDYLSGGFGRQIYGTTAQQRRAIYERALSPFDVGGRWQLPEDVGPETQIESERGAWYDLADMLLKTVAYSLADCTTSERHAILEVWRGWLDGVDAEGPPREVWDPLYSDLMQHVLKPIVLRPGVVYLDTRKVLLALTRTDVSGRVRMCHPVEELMRDLRMLHEQRRRDERASLLVLFPAECERDRETGLGIARRVWASGR